MICLPNLHQVGGRITNWLKKEGEAIECYELLLEVTTDTLTEEANKVDKRFTGDVTLVIESHEGGYLAKLLKDEKAGHLPVGTPIAILCEEETEVSSTGAGATSGMSALLIPIPFFLLTQIEEVSSMACPYDDLYSPEAQKSLRIANWQAYLKDKPGKSIYLCIHATF